MIFLVRYDRARGQLVSKAVFADTERAAAHRARLELELQLNKSGVDHEVVLLDAVSEEALRRTHERYSQAVEDFPVPEENSPVPVR